MSESDTSLIARVVSSGDRAAFELLVRRHQSGVRNFLRRLCRDDQDRGDDLSQETFTKVYRSLQTFQGGAQFSTWLYRIAYNTFLNDQRKQKSESSFNELEHGADTNSLSQIPNALDLERALRVLSRRELAVFDLHFQKGMTHTEISNALEVPLGTIKSDLTRGRDKMRAFLEGGHCYES